MTFRLSILFCLFLVGCAGKRVHSYPELINQQFSPVRSGIVTHMRPETNEERKQYKIASAKLMRQFCRGDFKVLSEGRTDEVIGAAAPSGQTLASANQTRLEKEKKVAIKFECDPSRDVQLDK